MAGSLTGRSRLNVFAFLVVLFVLSGLPLKASDVMELSGHYMRSEYGDYTYAIVNAGGEERSLFCPFPILDVLDAMRPEGDLVFLYTGREEFIPEAGQAMWIEEVQAVFIPDSYDPSFGLWLTVGHRDSP